MRVAAAFVLGVLLAACTAGPPASQTPAPISPSATEVPTPLPQRTPPSTEAPLSAGSYDGIWNTGPLTEDDYAAALERRGLDASGLPEWLGDWSKTTYRMTEFAAGGGRWLDSEYSDGVVTSGFDSPLELEADGTIVLTDEAAHCGAKMEATRDGDELLFEVTEDTCPNDLEAMTVLYESAPFHLVQEAGYSAPGATPAPALDPSAGPPTRGASTSGARVTAHPDGTVDGAPLGYLEYLPPNYGREPAPLLVALHGSGESGDGSELGLSVLARGGIPQLIKANFWPDDRPFVVLAPQHDEDPPSFCMESSEIDAFLRFALDHYDVDPNRVYVTGLSCGAIGMWNYLREHGSELVAAAISVAGYGVAAVDERGCELGALPIWAFHGEDDENVAVLGDVYPMTKLQSCTDPPPVDARLTVFPNSGHDVWTRVYNNTTGYNIYDWLLSHTR